MRKCTHPDCDRDVLARELCKLHYYKARAAGVRWNDGRKGGRLHIEPFEQRLWRQVNRCGPDECWPWMARQKVAGYGYLSRGSREDGKILAHRAVWELTHGPIPERPDLHHGLVVLHTCDNRLCCNPAHLVLGTQAENVKDMDNKSRRKKVSPRGEKHHMTKTTKEDVLSIRASTERAGILAARYGINRNTVTRIRTGQTWKED